MYKASNSRVGVDMRRISAQSIDECDSSGALSLSMISLCTQSSPSRPGSQLLRHAKEAGKFEIGELQPPLAVDARSSVEKESVGSIVAGATLAGIVRGHRSKCEASIGRAFIKAGRFDGVRPFSRLALTSGKHCRGGTRSILTASIAHETASTSGTCNQELLVRARHYSKADWLSKQCSNIRASMAMP